MATRHSSRVFDAGLRLFDRLSELSWSAHPVTAVQPKLSFGDEWPDKGAEKVCVMLDVEQTETRWARLSPAGRDEPITMLVLFRSWVPVPNQTTRDVWERLSVVSLQIESVLYDFDARVVVPLGFDGEVAVGRTSGVQPTVFPADEGWFGQALHRIELLANL